MDVGKPTKVYGLSFPTRHSKNEPKKIIESVFKDESDDEPEEPTFRQLEPRKSTIHQARINRKTKSDLEKALEEDPSIFQYDEVLDEIHVKKDMDLSNLFSKAPRESKYVGRLLKSANERKLERELCAERKAQREIESEADLYKEKESFVTSAYKQKLVELRDLVEKHKEEEYRENVMDVTKQDGLGGFYRYMFERETDQEPNSKTAEEKEEKPFEQTNISHSSSSEEKDRDKRYPPNCDSKGKYKQIKIDADRSTACRDKSNVSVKENQSTANKCPNVEEVVGVTSKETKKSDIKSNKVTKVDYGPGFIAARPRATTSEELEAARNRYLARKAAGIHALIVESD